MQRGRVSCCERELELSWGRRGGGEEISRLVREGIKREVDGLLDRGELVWGKEGEDDWGLWAGGPGSGVRL